MATAFSDKVKLQTERQEIIRLISGGEEKGLRSSPFDGAFGLILPLGKGASM